MSIIATLTSPAPTLAAFGGGTGVLLPKAPTLDAVATRLSGSANLSLSMPTLSIRGGSDVALTAPFPTLAISATFTGMGTAALAAPTPTLAAAGTVSASANAALLFGFDASGGIGSSGTYKLVGYSGGVISITTGGRTISATGSAGNVGSARLTLPLFDLVATGTVSGLSSASLLAPMPTMGSTVAYMLAPSATLVATGSATIAVTYDAYSLNLNHLPRQDRSEPNDEMTRYTNYPFDRVVRYKNSYFGMNATGLYLLEGTTDNGTAIPWEVKTCLTDAKTPQLKTVESAYIGGRFGPNATVTLYAGEASSTPYAYTTPRDTTVQNYRQPLGRGIKSRYFALGLAGTGALTVDSITLNIATLARKV